jgi:hypothetical protein
LLFASRSSWHFKARSPKTVGSLNVKALEHVLNVLGLVDEGALAELLYLKAKKEFTPIMDISNMSVINIAN